jgi:GxxExxY protein
MVDIDVITGHVLDLSIRIHKALGPGMLESAYEQVLAGKLTEMGYLVERQQLLDIEFEGHRISGAFRIDIFVERRLLIEVKVVERLVPAHTKQMLTYLRLANQSVGLLINFGGGTLVEGYKRLVNDYQPSANSAFSARIK